MRTYRDFVFELRKRWRRMAFYQQLRLPAFLSSYPSLCALGIRANGAQSMPKRVLYKS